MSSFKADSCSVIEQGANYDEMVGKYPDSYIVVRNGHMKDGETYGDVVAILTQEEYNPSDIPRNFVPRFTVWEGNSIAKGVGCNRVGHFV
jgi:hypothetical protein